MKNIFSELNGQYEFLSKTEKKIADLIIKKPEEFINFSMGRLSELSGVSQGSINNFSKKFSSGGFSALKLKIAGSLSEKGKQPFAVTDKERGIKGNMEIKIEEAITAFRNTLETNSEDTLSLAAEKILAAKKIEIYGIYQSGLSGKDFSIQLIQLGLPAVFVEDTLISAVSATMLDDQSVVIAISSSGKTKEIIEAADLAKKSGATIVCLTADRFSPLAKNSDIVLLSPPSGISESGRNNEIRFSQQLVLNSLCGYLSNKIDANGESRYYKIKEILDLHSIKD